MRGAPRATAEAAMPLNTAEAALHLGVHVNTIKHIPPEQLPFFRVGNRGDRRYKMADIEAYITVRTAR